MKFPSHNYLAPLLVITTLATSSGLAVAQSYPAQDVHFVVGFAAGPVAPTSSRVLLQKKCGR